MDKRNPNNVKVTTQYNVTGMKDHAEMTVSEWLHYLAQNDHMIDGKYLESGHALLTARSVYDAAMALFEHEQGYKPQDDDLANGWPAYRAERARLMLNLTAACRRAKEGR